MQALLDTLLGSSWWLIAATAIYGVSWSVYSDIYDHSSSRERWIVFLCHDYWALLYRLWVIRGLKWVDRYLTPAIPRKRVPGIEVQIAWSAPLLGLCLLLAVAYPLVSVIGQWALLNVDGRIGDLVLIRGDAPLWHRAGTIGGIAGGTALMLASTHARGWRRIALFMAGAILAFAGAAAVAVAGAAAVAVAVAGTVAVALAAGGAVAVAVAGAGAVAVAGTVAVALAAAGTVAGTVAVATAVAGTVAVATAGTVAGAVAAAFGQDRLGSRTGRPALALGGYALALLGAVALASAAFDPPPGAAEGARTLLLFLGVLPLMNALADFASLGMTRYSLRRGAVRGGTVWLWMLIDVAAGIAIFFALGLALILWIVLVPAGGQPLIDLPALFDGIRASLAAPPARILAPGQVPPEPLPGYWWLYLMLFSTLLPTVVHLVFASFGSVLKLSPRLRRHIAAGLEAGGAGDRVSGRWAVQWLCLSMTLTVMVPVLVVVTLWQNRAAIGLATLELFEAFHAWLA